MRQAAAAFGPVGLGWGGLVELSGRWVGVAHGHLSTDVRRVLAERPDVLLTGHVHCAFDLVDGPARASSSPSRVSNPPNSWQWGCWS